MTQAVPGTLGRYQIDEQLAVGGMAELFKGRVVGAHGFQKPVVIKRILPHFAADPAFVSMFIDEANITARLDHPKIAQVLELGLIDNQLFIAMEFVDGRDLRATLNRSRAQATRIPAPIAAYIALELLDALGYAHGLKSEEGTPLGVIHRDISPSNVLLSWRGDVKLADFGIARAMAQPRQTQAGVIKGKYHYLAPEQVSGVVNPDGRSDLFAVGTVLAEMLIGRKLFAAANQLDLLVMVRDAQIHRFDQHGADLDPELRAIVRLALQKEPDARFQTAAEFAANLADWLYQKRIRVGAPELAAYLRGLFEGAPLSEKISGASTIALAIDDCDALFDDSAEPDASRAAATVASAALFESPVVADRTEAGPSALALPPQSAIPAPSAPRKRPTSSSRRPIIREGTAPAVAAAAKAVARPRLPRADESGDLAVTSPAALLHRLHLEKATALLVVEQHTKERFIYLVDGRILEVRSSAPDEAFDAFLERAQLISDLERSMALAMLPQFGGSLPHTLVELGVLDRKRLGEPLRRHAQNLLLDVLALGSGAYRLYLGQRSPTRVFPMTVDVMELLKAAALALPETYLETWARSRIGSQLEAAPEALKVAKASNLGKEAVQMCEHLDGRSTLRQLLHRHNESGERMRALRLVHLLIELGLVVFA